MTTAALDVTDRRDDPSAGVLTGDDLTHASTLEPTALVALATRPLAVFVATTALAHLLTGRWSEPTGAPTRAYGPWLGQLFPFRSDALRAAGDSVQLLAASLLVAMVTGAVLGLALRTRRLTGGGARLGVLIAALSAPVTAIVFHHLLLVRFDTGLRPGSVALTDNWGRGIDTLVAPALAVGLTLAAPVAAMVAGTAFTSGPYGGAAMASPLADRAPWGRPWRIGVPGGLLVAGLVVTELLFDRDGLFRLVVTATDRQDRAVALEAVALLALAAAAVALVVDLADLLSGRGRRHRLRTARAGVGVGVGAGVEAGGTGAGVPGPAFLRRPSPRQMRLAVGLVVTLAVIGGAGLLGAPSPRPDPGARLGRPLIDGLLGTDSLGRDLTLLAAAGLGQAFLAVTLPALVAAVAALGLAGVERRFPRAGRLVPGLPIDALWWPLPLMVLLASRAFGAGTLGLLDPRILALVAVGLLPTAVRLAHRSPLWTGPGRLLGLAGLWLLLAPVALTANLVAAFAGFDRPTEPSLGQQLGAATATLTTSPWPALVPAVTLTAALAAWLHLGSHLTTLAWHRSNLAAALPAPPPVSPETATLTEHPEPDEAAAPEATASDDPPVPTGPEPGILQPNFSLQPGLPPPELGDTMQLPVVRVKVADPAADQA